MKFTPVLLTLSLVANAALVGYVATRPGAAAPATTASTSGAAPGGGASRGQTSAALRAALESGDPAALEAAGVPKDIARQIALGRAFDRYAIRMRELQHRDDKWWRNRGLAGANREQLAAARREFSDALVTAGGNDLATLLGNDNGALSFLSADKQQAFRRIAQDYDEMMAKFSASGIQLPSDREKLKLLREERDRDIAALLSPQEYAEYELRTSPSATTLRARYGDAIENEDDFRKLFALQKAFDEKNPPLTGRITAEQMQQRSAAERQLQDDMRAALGDDKYAALRRAADSDLRNVDQLAQRLNLPADTTSQVAAARETYAAESQRISSDTSIPPQQRRAQIQDLASRAKSDLAKTLGAEAAEAYGQRSTWLNMLQGGIAYSTNPKDAPAGAAAIGGQTVFPVMPAGAGGGPGVQRQVVNIVSSAGDAGTASGGAFFGPTVITRPGESAQVISVVSSNSTTTTATTPPPPNANPSTGTTPQPPPQR